MQAASSGLESVADPGFARQRRPRKHQAST